MTIDELPDFQIPLIDSENNSFFDNKMRDEYLENKLPVELFLKHEGLKITYKGNELVLTIDCPRDALEMSIFEYGRKHFYGNLVLPSIGIICDGKANLNKDKTPIFLKKIILTRILTPREAEITRVRWQGYSAGDRVEAFNTSLEVITQAKDITQRHFPGFKLIIPENYRTVQLPLEPER